MEVLKLGHGCWRGDGRARWVLKGGRSLIFHVSVSVGGSTALFFDIDGHLNSEIGVVLENIVKMYSRGQYIAWERVGDLAAILREVEYKNREEMASHLELGVRSARNLLASHFWTQK